MRIAPLRHSDFDRVSRLLLGQSRQEDQREDQDPGDDDEYYQSHGERFCRDPKPLYSPLRLWIWGSVLTGPWFSSG